MNKKTKQTRFNQLFFCLQYCTEQNEKGLGNHFTAGQRICINQERGQLLNFPNFEDFISAPAPDFEHDAELSRKIDFITDKIQQSNWKPKAHE